MALVQEIEAKYSLIQLKCVGMATPLTVGVVGVAHTHNPKGTTVLVEFHLDEALAHPALDDVEKGLLEGLPSAFGRDIAQVAPGESVPTDFFEALARRCNGAVYLTEPRCTRITAMTFSDTSVFGS